MPTKESDQRTADAIRTLFGLAPKPVGHRRVSRDATHYEMLTVKGHRHMPDLSWNDVQRILTAKGIDADEKALMKGVYLDDGTFIRDAYAKVTSEVTEHE